MRSFFATHNLFAVSALLRETGINTEQTLSHGFKIDRSAMYRFARRRESDGDEAIGLEEAGSLYDLGALADLSFSFKKCQPQMAALILAYGLGSVSTAAWGTGQKHTITPIAGDLDTARSNPSFTGAMRYGKWLLKERFASNFVDNFQMRLKKDSWLELSGNIRATGKRATTVFSESITAAYNATTLTLANGVSGGAVVQDRLDNVHHVRVQVPTTLEWKDVVVTAASAATPCILAIVAPGGVATSTTYKVIYNQAEAGSYTWASFPNRVVESPLRISDFVVKLGGKWDGSVWLEGHTMNAEIKELVWDFNNNLKCEFVPGGTGSYANRALRDGRTQKLTLDRDFRDYIVGQRLDENDTFSIYAKATGAEFETGKNYYVWIVFPKVGVIDTPYKEDGGRLAEDCEFQILQDETYGSVWAQVANMVATYAA